MNPLLLKLALTGALTFPVYNELSWIGVLMLWVLVLQEEACVWWRDNEKSILDYIHEVDQRIDTAVDNTIEKVKSELDELKDKL